MKTIYRCSYHHHLPLRPDRTVAGSLERKKDHHPIALNDTPQISLRNRKYRILGLLITTRILQNKVMSYLGRETLLHRRRQAEPPGLHSQRVKVKLQTYTTPLGMRVMIRSTLTRERRRSSHLLLKVERQEKVSVRVFLAKNVHQKSNPKGPSTSNSKKSIQPGIIERRPEESDSSCLSTSPVFSFPKG